MTLSPHQFRGFQKYYHGSNVGPEKILKEGLKAHNPSEELNIHYGLDPDTIDEGHPIGVYMSRDKNISKDYGRHLYSIELPEPHKDWGWTESEGSVWTKDIPPHWIRYEDNA